MSTTSVFDISTDLDGKWTTASSSISSKTQDVEVSGASAAMGCSVDPLNLRNGIRPRTKGKR
ncbi:hypothetical protein EDD85DRAFT_953439 [Armillaria nabsnona]|nr:hypothetical protein EDD85DRAFT_953439 [Armillaria nabsnona]